MKNCPEVNFHGGMYGGCNCPGILMQDLNVERLPYDLSHPG